MMTDRRRQEKTHAPVWKPPQSSRGIKLDRMPRKCRPLVMPSQFRLPNNRGGAYIPHFDPRTNRCWWEWAKSRKHYNEDGEELRDEENQVIDDLDDVIEDAFEAFHKENDRREWTANRWREANM